MARYWFYDVYKTKEVALMNADELKGLRLEKDQFFKSSPHSPLSPGQQDAFQGLRYFEYNPALTLEVAATRLGGEEIRVQTTSGELRRYRRYARFRFEIAEESAELTVYETPHGYFLPFIDSSPGIYGGGRYLEPELIEETAETARFVVDFNLAYNPYCAFADGFSCPLVPTENRLKVAVTAGECSPD